VHVTTFLKIPNLGAFGILRKIFGRKYVTTAYLLYVLALASGFSIVAQGINRDIIILEIQKR